MFRRLPVELQRLAAALRAEVLPSLLVPSSRRARPPRRSSPARSRPLVGDRGFFYVVVWRPGFALGVWQPFEDATGRVRAYRKRATAERAGLEVRSHFDGIVAVQQGDAATWVRCKRFRLPRAL